MITKTLYDLCNSIRKTLVSRELLPLNALERVHMFYLDEIADKTLRTIAEIEAEALGAPPGTRHYMTPERIAALREGLDDIREDTVRKGGSCSLDEWIVLWNREVEARNLLHDVRSACRDRLWQYRGLRSPYSRPGSGRSFVSLRRRNMRRSDRRSKTFRIMSRRNSSSKECFTKCPIGSS